MADERLRNERQLIKNKTGGYSCSSAIECPLCLPHAVKPKPENSTPSPEPHYRPMHKRARRDSAEQFHAAYDGSPAIRYDDPYERP